MPLITPTDIYNCIYEEIVDEIVREQNNITLRAIDGAIEEAKMYLSKYDLAALFGTPDTEPSVTAIFLKNICVDLAIWQLIRLGNPNIRYEDAKFNYESARQKLRDIQSGKAMPDGWPYRDTTNDTTPNGSAVEWTSQPKRRNFFY